MGYYDHCLLGFNAVLVKLFPDKDTPGIHQELTEISEGITDIGQIMKPIAQEAQFNNGVRIANTVIKQANKLNKVKRNECRANFINC